MSGKTVRIGACAIDRLHHMKVWPNTVCTRGQSSRHTDKRGNNDLKQNRVTKVGQPFGAAYDVLVLEPELSGGVETPIVVSIIVAFGEHFDGAVLSIPREMYS